MQIDVDISLAPPEIKIGKDKIKYPANIESRMSKCNMIECFLISSIISDITVWPLADDEVVDMLFKIRMEIKT